MSIEASGRLLRTPSGERFRFDAGAVCLDFVYTGGRGRWAAFETLHQPADLSAWLSAPPLRAHLTAPVSWDQLDRAKDLREAIRESAWSMAHGRRPERRHLATINQAARPAPLVPRLDPSDLHARWRRPVDVTQALSTLARETIHLFAGPLAARIRECSGDDCPLVFVDTSRPGTRRWCSMERCGNRLKLRAYRERRRGQDRVAAASRHDADPSPAG